MPKPHNLVTTISVAGRHLARYTTFTSNAMRYLAQDRLVTLSGAIQPLGLIKLSNVCTLCFVANPEMPAHPEFVDRDARLEKGHALKQLLEYKTMVFLGFKLQLCIKIMVYCPRLRLF